MTHFAEEYNTLRDEIGRLQEQGDRALEFGILTTSGVLALSFSTIVSPGYRWLVLFTPSFILIPFVYLIIHRVQTTWIIGRYIELCLEPKMGLIWERFNRDLRGDPKRRFFSHFDVSLAAPLLGIQIASPAISLLVGPVNIFYWLILTVLVLIIVLIEYVNLGHFTLTNDKVEEIKETIRLCELERNE
jgi:hypothetical protein